MLNNTSACIKNDDNLLFDMTIGSFDGAEVYELVSLYIWSKISVLSDSDNVELYKDDGIAVIQKANGSKLDRLRKSVIATLKNEGLSKTSETNLGETGFLDVTFNLSAGKYLPYNKPNNIPLYIQAKSNHLPSIIKQLPKMVDKRISDLPSDKNAFNGAKVTYKVVL